VRPYLEKTHHEEGLVEGLKVKTLSSNPSTTKKEKKCSQFSFSQSLSLAVWSRAVGCQCPPHTYQTSPGLWLGGCRSSLQSNDIVSFLVCLLPCCHLILGRDVLHHLNQCFLSKDTEAFKKPKNEVLVKIHRSDKAWGQYDILGLCPKRAGP
jgi:hypothetical protein